MPGTGNCDNPSDITSLGGPHGLFDSPKVVFTGRFLIGDRDRGRVQLVPGPDSIQLNHTYCIKF